MAEKLIIAALILVLGAWNVIAWAMVQAMTEKWSDKEGEATDERQ